MMSTVFHLSTTFLVFMLYVERNVTSANRRPGIFDGRSCKMEFESAELLRVIPAFHIRLINITKDNNSLPNLNVEFVVQDEKVMRYKLWLDGFEKYSKENLFKNMVLSSHQYVCDTLANYNYVNSISPKQMNMPRGCPFQLGKAYYLRQFRLINNAIPSPPGQRWRFDIQIGPEGSKNTDQSTLFKIYLASLCLDHRKRT